MGRHLRGRTSRPSYASLAGFEIDGPEDAENAEAGPSTVALALDEQDSGSDFAPEKDVEAGKGDPEEPDTDTSGVSDDDDAIPADQDEPIVVQLLVTAKKAPANPKSKGKAKATATDTLKPIKALPSRGPGLSGTGKSQHYVLPTPSVHHRHRAVPLFTRHGLVERLVSAPALFAQTKVTSTNNFTHNSKVGDRANKT